jgi:hypothetical protein
MLSLSRCPSIGSVTVTTITSQSSSRGSAINGDTRFLTGLRRKCCPALRPAPYPSANLFRNRKVWLYRLPTPGGELVSPSDFSTVMGNHLLAVAPLGRRVPISIQVLPVHLSSRIEPRLPPPVALVIATVKHSSALAGNANIAKQTDNSIVLMSLLLAKSAV